MSKYNFTRIAAAAVAAALSLGSLTPAMAEPDRRDRRDDRHERRDDRYNRDHDRDRWGNHVDWHRGYGPDRNYYVGQRMPTQYRERTYVVDDWRGHHLRQPPRGYHWVQSGTDYLLVAVATGLIASAIINSNY
ncbi:RcnB family protein [Burkholderiaceae bacterium UC74_6]